MCRHLILEGSYEVVNIIYLRCQFVPVGIFVVAKNGARQSKCHVNPQLVLHCCEAERR